MDSANAPVSESSLSPVVAGSLGCNPLRGWLRIRRRRFVSAAPIPRRVYKPRESRTWSPASKRPPLWRAGAAPRSADAELPQAPDQARCVEPVPAERLHVAVKLINERRHRQRRAVALRFVETDAEILPHPVHGEAEI